MKADDNRIYLEDIGEIVMSRGGKDIWLVKGITQHEDFKDRCLPRKNLCGRFSRPGCR